MDKTFAAIAADRVDACHAASLVSSTICPMDYDGRASDSRQANWFGGMQLGGAEVYCFGGRGLPQGSRRPHHIRQDRRDDFLVSIPLRSSAGFYQAGLHSEVGAGSFVFLSTAQPFDAMLGSAEHQDAFSELLVKIPGPLLRQQLPRIDDYSNLPMAIRPGSGNVMRSLVEVAFKEGGALCADQAHRLGHLLIEAIVNAAIDSEEYSAAHAQPRRTAHARLRDTAERFIEAHLSDTTLDAAMVARHCRISVRHLRAAFAASLTTVDTRIREMRLQFCRSALQNAALRSRSITEIAMEWGFNSSAHFSRAYRDRFGITPTMDRSSPAG